MKMFSQNHNFNIYITNQTKRLIIASQTLFRANDILNKNFGTVISQDYERKFYVC